jgi:hypothetical protein
MTISFSYAYLNGLLRRTVSIVTSADLESLSPVVMEVHRSSRAMSPRNTARGTNNETEFIPTLWITEEIRPTIHENGLGDIVSVVARDDVVEVQYHSPFV